MVALAVVLMTLAPPTVGAQDIRAQAARVDALARIANASLARRTAFDDSTAKSRQAMEVVSVGPFRILMQAGNRDLATRAAQLAADSLSLMGTQAIQRLSRHQFVVRTTQSPRWLTTSLPSVVVAVLDTQEVERLQLWAPTKDPTVVAGWFYQNAIHLLAAGFDTTFQRWLLAAPQFDSVTAFAWTQFRLDLVSSAAPPARRCYDGDLTACRVILGLTPTQDPVVDWFDPASRLRIANRLEPMLRPFDRDATDRCLAGVDSSCVSLLQRSKLLSQVTLSGHRVALVRTAIQLGGEQGVARLLDATGTPSERLAATAGVSADSVLRVWHGRVRNVRLPSDDMSVAIAGASLGWIGLLVLLSFRNSRWR